MTVHLWVSPETSNAVVPRQIKIKMPLGTSSFKGSLQLLNTQSDASPSWQGPGPIRTETACSTKAIPSFGAIASAILYITFPQRALHAFLTTSVEFATFAPPVLQGAVSPRVSAQCLKDTRAQTKPCYLSKEYLCIKCTGAVCKFLKVFFFLSHFSHLKQPSTRSPSAISGLSNRSGLHSGAQRAKQRQTRQTQLAQLAELSLV